MRNEVNGDDIYGIGVCLDTLSGASDRALALLIAGMDDPRITTARRLMNAQNVLNMYLKTVALNNQCQRHVEPLKQSEGTSQQAAVFQLHQTGANNHEAN